MNWIKITDEMPMSKINEGADIVLFSPSNSYEGSSITKGTFLNGRFYSDETDEYYDLADISHHTHFAYITEPEEQE